MIEIQNLTFGYNSKQHVLENFSLTIDPGTVYGLLGKNGTGKSTLLHLMAGLLSPQKGKVYYQQKETFKRHTSTLQDLFIVTEEFSLPRISMKQFVKSNAPFYPRFSEEILHSSLQHFELSKDIQLNELSMGQKKKAFICFALATNTSLLLLDEPSNGLDIPSKTQFRKAIAACMNEEKTIILSTHQINDIDSLLDHIVIIDDAQLILHESVSNICQKLYFTEQEINDSIEDVIYSQSSIRGKQCILPNKSGLDSKLNLELLFNAVLTEKSKIQQIFQP